MMPRRPELRSTGILPVGRPGVSPGKFFLRQAGRPPAPQPRWLCSLSASCLALSRFAAEIAVPHADGAIVMTKSHRIHVVATPLWGVRILGVPCSERRTAPWLQRLHVHKMASGKFISALTAIAFTGSSATIFAQGGAKPANASEGTVMVK